MSKILKKLRSKKGESIGEVLVALLISSLGLTLLAGMITSAKSVLDRSKTKMDSYNGNIATLVKHTSDIRFTGDVSIKVKEQGGEYKTWDFTVDTSAANVNYYVTSDFQSTPVVAYSV